MVLNLLALLVQKYLLSWYKVQILTPEALVWRDMSLLVEKAVTRRLLKKKILAVSAYSRTY